MIRRQEWLPLVAVPLGVAVMAWLLVVQGPLRYIENWFGDLRVALVTPRQPASDEVVVLTINDDTLSTFPYRSPVSRAFLAELVTLLNQKGVKAIGLDILFDHPCMFCSEGLTGRGYKRIL